MNTTFQPLSTALTPRRARTLPLVILIIAMLAALAAAAYGYLEQQRTERVLLVVRPVAYGQPLRAEDLGTIELAYHRPAQLAGISDPARAIGRYAARALTVNDLLQPAMLLDRPPSQPVYPSGETLPDGMVATPFSIATVGPLTADDTLNLGYLDPTGDPARCLAAGGQPQIAAPAMATAGAGAPSPLAQPYACRLLSGAAVLYVDEAQQLAYLALTPAQSLALRALQAAQLGAWAERYGAESPALPPLDRLDPAQISPALLATPVGDAPDTQPEATP